MQSDTLLTLTEIAEKTGINATTLSKYASQYAARIPCQGEGRKRRYPPEAIPVFLKLREEGLARKGRPRKEPLIITQQVFTGEDRLLLGEIGQALEKIGKVLQRVASRR
ncbi:MAG TPA: hypothetical protein VF173_19500 [Thermoanaerobaculia bacterium]|nr:hypothetical protein [Thermoanaerobaculia bacterium]